jgi:hypothetical protein
MLASNPPSTPVRIPWLITMSSSPRRDDSIPGLAMSNQLDKPPRVSAARQYHRNQVLKRVWRPWSHLGRVSRPRTDPWHTQGQDVRSTIPWLTTDIFPKAPGQQYQRDLSILLHAWSSTRDAQCSMGLLDEAPVGLLPVEEAFTGSFTQCMLPKGPLQPRYLRTALGSGHVSQAMTHNERQ